MLEARQAFPSLNPEFHLQPRRPERDVGTLGAEVTGACELRGVNAGTLTTVPLSILNR